MVILILLLLVSPFIHANNTAILRLPKQSVEAFLVENAPKDKSKLSHYTKKEIELSGKKFLIAVYEFNDEQFEKAEEKEDRQFVYAYLSTVDNKYEKIPVVGIFDDGGSPSEVLAVFTAKFEKGASSALGLLTRWDSSRAGGRLAMTRSGAFYSVMAFDFDGKEFKTIKSSIVNKLGGCDCTIYDENRNQTGTEKAKAKTVSGIKQQLKKLGIPQ